MDSRDRRATAEATLIRIERVLRRCIDLAAANQPFFSARLKLLEAELAELRSPSNAAAGTKRLQATARAANRRIYDLEVAFKADEIARRAEVKREQALLVAEERQAVARLRARDEAAIGSGWSGVSPFDLRDSGPG